MNDFKIIVMVPIFIILMVVTFNAIKSAFNLNVLCCLIMSVCVSALAIIGMNQFLTGSMELILLPYTAMAIAILAVLLFALIGKHLIRIKQWLSRRTDKRDIRETRKERLRR